VAAGSGTITDLGSFAGFDGAYPVAGMIMDGNGNLFGTTSGGGAAGFGTVFELAKGGGITALASFTGTNGADSQAALVMDASGNVFGTTLNGGTPNMGTVFELAAGSSTITTLASFSAPNGGNPWDAPIVDAAGNLYGTTQDGGAYGGGTVFELPHGSSTLTTLASFTGAGGATPKDSPIMDAGGNLYGTTFNGGTFGFGTVFELAKGSGTITTLWSFEGTKFGDGANPYGGLVMDASGNLYGTTTIGGAFNYGTVFELAAGSTTLTILASFTNTNGSSPHGTLTLDSSGNLYGTAQGGGTSNDGVIFEVAAGSGTITDLASFNRTNGQGPLAGLLMDASGNLYGTTQKGGHDFYGTVFEWVASTGKINVLASFNGTTEAAYPYATPVMDAKGNLYGTAYVGDPAFDGTVWEVVKGSGKITTLVAFNGADGQGPLAGLLMDSSGDLFGTTSGAGPGGLGTLFELPGAAAVVDQWTGANFAVDTNWSDGKNWSLGAPPTPAETALFTNNSTVKSFTSTVDAAFAGTVGGLVIDGTWGGTITVNSALTANGNFAMASGTFGGDGAVTVAGDAMQWTGGQIVVGTGGFTNTGVLTADTSGGNLVVSGTGTLTDQGTIHEAGTNSVMLENGATLANTGTLDLTDNGNVGQSGGGTLTNSGTLDKSGGTGTSTISSSFINSAAITVDTGTLTIASAGGTSTGGVFTVAKGATLDLTGGVTVAYAGSYTGTGLGTVALRSGTFAVGTGGATFAMPGSLFQWSGGAIDVTNGNFTNTGTVNDPGTGNVILTGAGTLTNDGTFTEAGARSLLVEKAATFDNAAGATFDLTANGSVRRSGRSTFTNEGTFEKTGGSGTSTVATTKFSNTGTVDVAKGTLDISATVKQVSGTTLTAGAWIVTGTSKIHATLDITSTGSLTTIGNGAQVTLDGLNTAFTNLAGLTTVAQGGSFSLLGGQSFTTAGALTADGSVTLGAGSVLTVSGGFTQGTSGTLNVELGGTSTAPTFGQLVSTTGTVSLAGSLVVTSTVVPAVGSSFELLDNEGNAAISGTFKKLPEGATIKVKHGATTMKFRISYVGSDADGNQNVVITRIS
jgi:uncharacterized repeat protein (TIGR03803 family)